MMGMYGFAPWGVMVGGAMMLLFWGGVIALVAWAVSQFSGRGAGGDPVGVLGRRLAAGEITQEQYEQARRVLEH